MNIFRFVTRSLTNNGIYGKARTPGGGTDLAAMMGKEETLRRLNAAIEAL